mmetsp:Transcript_45766/g.116324  ORF Transcript_45766/g.116324 Transcript_45766/m.116324 type:complete len:227 (+) Transcript_45766:127-807(+)
MRLLWTTHASQAKGVKSVPLPCGSCEGNNMYRRLPGTATASTSRHPPVFPLWTTSQWTTRAHLRTRRTPRRRPLPQLPQRTRPRPRRRRSTPAVSVATRGPAPRIPAARATRRLRPARAPFATARAIVAAAAALGAQRSAFSRVRTRPTSAAQPTTPPSPRLATIAPRLRVGAKAARALGASQARKVSPLPRRMRPRPRPPHQARLPPAGMRMSSRSHRPRPHFPL